MTEEYMTSAEIKKKIAELKIQLAFQLEFEEQLERTLAECQQAEAGPEEVMKAGKAKIFREIDAAARTARAEARKRTGRLHAWKVVMIAAVLMAVSISSALAAICMVEAGILKVDVQDKGTVFRLIAPDNRAAVPEGWQGEYYPSYIPEGYMFSGFMKNGVCYTNRNGKKLYFDENLYGDRVGADTEGAIVSYVMVNGVEAMVAEKDGATTVARSMNGKYFVVSIDEGKETALRIAASVEPID